MPPKKTTAPTVPTAETPLPPLAPTRKPKPPARLPSLSYHHLPPQVDEFTSWFWWSTTCRPGHSNHTAIQKPVIPKEVCELDVFNRSNTHKLQPFLVQCTLNFHNCPDAFISNSDKTTFTLSYLKGTMLDWFELLLTSGKSLPWLNNYSDFVRELKGEFRPHDPKGNLENLKMCDNQHIMKYPINFNHLATCVQWGVL